ncbi:MAG: electron transfer flavoprotein subunit alpha/FixB family protein [Deltaproteobacteria bacterium]|nr:electron transfer flavoprotein subunit alpha/FixB family protein [Deltaproteobacteria bacterium]
MSVIVITERTGDTITQASWEAITCAVELAGKAGSLVTVIVMGRSIREEAERIAGMTGLSVLGIEGDALDLFNAEVYKNILVEVLPEMTPDSICLPHTAATGYDLAPALAVRLGASCITAVDKVNYEGEVPVFLRTGMGGKIVEHVAPTGPCMVLTVLPGAWPPFRGTPSQPGDVRLATSHRTPEKTCALGIREATGDGGMDLQKADVIVAAGRGVEKEEYLSLIEALARIFAKSAIGASRGACDKGWFGYGRQIGVTGQTVSPRLYIACGISGAIQHISGMKGSQVVAAVNTDRKAPIFSVADFCVVDDLARFIPAFVEVCRKHRGAA